MMKSPVIAIDTTTQHNSRRATARADTNLLVDSSEAASICGLGLNSFLLLARSGQIPGLRHGRVWRFRRADLTAWLDLQISMQTQARQDQ